MKHELAAHLFISSSDGSLCDTRRKDWAEKPLRENYQRQHSSIASLADVKATLRAGGFAWPGGYPLFFMTRDGAALCFDCVRKEFRQIVWDFLNDTSTGWRIAGCEVNWEDSECNCDHCSKLIPSAYGE